MLRKILLAGFGLCIAATAHGADLCVVIEGGGGFAVGKNFKFFIPPQGIENTCQPFSGFEQAGLRGGVTGTGCVSRNGAEFLFHYSYHNFDEPRGKQRYTSYFETGTCRFRIANVGGQKSTGSCRGTVLTHPTGSHGSFLNNAVMFECSEDVPPW